MEAREILVANTKTQKRSKITTSAETLGELKAALAAEGIDYSGMTFTEGITKTQLLDDTTPLPKEVMYKGNPTNSLVILLTNTKKNIASGFEGTRKDAYDIIRENGLMEGIKEEFGYNYTNVSTDDLWNYINEHVTDEDIDDDSCGCCDGDPDWREGDEVPAGVRLMAAILNHVCLLGDLGLVDYNDVQWLTKHLTTYAENELDHEDTVESSDGRITNDDIDEMIQSVQ